MLAYLSKLESKLNQVGTNLAQDASILSQVGLRKKAFLSEEKTSWRQVGPKSAPEGPRSLSQRVYTSTRLTFIIEKAHSPNFHQSTGGLKTPKWSPRPPKMTKKRPQKQLQMFPIRSASSSVLFLLGVFPWFFWDVCCLQVGFMLVMLVLCLLTANQSIALSSTTMYYTMITILCYTTLYYTIFSYAIPYYSIITNTIP